MKGSPKLTLYYFPVMARGHSIRMALHHKGVAFEDRVVSMEEWGELKPKFEYGVLPVLEVDGVNYSQQRPILRYIGKQLGYYPKDDLQALDCDAFLDGLEDAMSKAGIYCFNKVMMKNPKWKDLIPDSVSAYKGILKVAEGKLEGKKYLVGEMLTCADFYFFSSMKSFPYNPGWTELYGDLEHDFPNCTRYYKMLNEELAVAFKKAGDQYPF